VEELLTVSSAGGWDRLRAVAVRLPSGLAPDQVVLTASRRAQASVEGQLQKSVYCVYYSIWAELQGRRLSTTTPREWRVG
jgi:hypothetical protein